MKVERHKFRKSYVGIIPMVLAGLLALPFVLIGLATFEEVVVGTDYITVFYRSIGVFAPLDWLLDNTFGRLID